MGTLGEYDRIAAALFGKTKSATLSILFGQPNSRFYLRQIVEQARCGAGAVQRELKRMTDSGLIIRENVGNHVYFRANHDSPVFREISSLVTKTTGCADILRKALSSVSSQIQFAFIFGSTATGTATASSDIDLLIIGRLTFTEAVNAVAKAQTRLDREINPVVFSQSEFVERKKANDPFVRGMDEAKKIMLVGDIREFEKLGR